MRKTILIFFLPLFFQGRVQAQQEAHEVVFFSTNDPHGQLDGFARIAALVRAEKRRCRDVFVFNAGDLVNGNPVVDEAADKGYPITDIMNDIPYDVSCPGNHEFENGEATLQRRIAQSTSVYVAANMRVAAGSPLKHLQPYTLLHTTDGTTIAVLGLTTGSSNPCMAEAVTVDDPIKVAQGYKWLKVQYPVLVTLSHIGYKRDSVLAMRMGGIDVIIGGHSHTVLDGGRNVNGVLITQTGSHLKYLGKTVLILRNHKVVSKTFSLVDLSGVSETDSAVGVKIRGYESNTPFGEPIGTVGADFRNKEELGALKTDAIAEGLHVDVAFDDIRNITFSNFTRGVIRLGDIYRLDPFDYRIVRCTLDAEDMRKMILKSLKNEPGRPVLFVSGITYSVDTARDGHVVSVTIRDRDGTVPDAGKRYSVGMNSYIACHFLEAADAGETVPSTTADELIRYLMLHAAVDYTGVKRIVETCTTCAP
jgi:2',3'-cyclic-nucleotide 2'-phosphodiesterase (5'-nucleotidase family)